MSPKRLLLVEDETIVRMHLERIVRELGCEVVGTAASSEEALEVASRQRPDLVLMDIRIQGTRDGIEVARELRDRYGLPSVFVTAYADQETVQRVQEVGALGYLVKPFNRAEVGAVITTALTQRDTLGRLEERSRALHAVLESSEDAVVVLDEAGRVTSLNSEASRLTGWTSMAASGLPADEVLRLAPTEGVRDMLDVAEEQRVEDAEIVDREGGRHRVEIEVAPLRDAEGQRTGSFVVLREARPGGEAPETTSAAPGAVRAALAARYVAHHPRFHDLVGRSEPMQRVFEAIRELAKVDWNVLVEGETGTGKELVARAIHASSTRAAGPFVAVNCAGLSESLLASQLFGHRKGAFTGAVRDQEGVFEVAHGGTLFLDEIGDMALGVQKTLLRVLEERRFTRLGDARPRDVDVRVVAASQHDLGAEVAAKRFRADLLFRLRVARVQLPPLRERREDVPLLAHWFLSHSRKAAGKAIGGIADEAVERLVAYDWPGNVRELRSAIDFAVLACRTDVITPTDLPPEIQRQPASGAAVPSASSPLPAAGTRAAPADERQRFLTALAESGGNRTRAARLLGISRATFYRRLAELGIDPQ